jgi:hypothetical protein
MEMTLEVTVRQDGTVAYCEEGVLYDPVLDRCLSVDGEGRIRGLENPGVSGTLSENGNFFWTGFTEEHGRLNHVTVKGSLVPLPPSARGIAATTGCIILST